MMMENCLGCGLPIEPFVHAGIVFSVPLGDEAYCDDCYVRKEDAEYQAKNGFWDGFWSDKAMTTNCKACGAKDSRAYYASTDQGDPMGDTQLCDICAEAMPHAHIVLWDSQEVFEDAMAEMWK